MEEFEGLKYKKLNYFDFYNEVEKFFQSEYEKSNLYPLEKYEDDVDLIFDEEINEVASEVENLKFVFYNERGDSVDDYLLTKLKNVAIKTIFECLQVVSLCDKYKEGD